MNKIELKDFLSFTYLSNPQFSPNGAHIAYVVTEADEAENSYRSNIWVIKDGENMMLTGLGEESGFIWEDDTHILFKACRDKADQKRKEEKDVFTSYYRIPIDGGEAQKAYTFDFDVKGIRVIQGGQLAIVGEIDCAHPDFYKMDADARKDILKAYKDAEDYQVIDEIPFWHNGGSYSNKRRNALFIYDSASKKIERITAEYTQVLAVEIVGRTVYYAAVTYEQEMPLMTDLYAYHLDTGETEAILDKNDFSVSSLKRLDDTLFITGSALQDHGLNENSHFYTLDGKNMKRLKAYDYSLGSSVGSDCRFGGGDFAQAGTDKLYFITTVRNASVIQAIDKAGHMEPIVTGEGSVDSLTVSENGRIAFVGMREQRLQELYEWVDGAAKPLTHFNDAALKDKYVAKPEKLTVSSQGTEIDGWVLKPIDFDPDKSYPAILDIHGGPKTVYGEVYYHEMQYFASEGYFVLFCNPTGSDGRGNAFMDIRGKYGTVDYENLMDFTDAALKAYPQIDVNRLGETGGSYGGFMTNWIVGHTDRFKACVTQRSISNWLSFYGMSDIGFYFATDQMGVQGFSVEEQERMWAQSPLKYVENVKTPLLFIHSDMDYRCNLEEGLQFFTAVARQGVDTRMVVFKGENHELSRSGKPKHRVRRLEEIIGWLDTYLKK